MGAEKSDQEKCPGRRQAGAKFGIKSLARYCSGDEIYRLAAADKRSSINTDFMFGEERYDSETGVWSEPQGAVPRWEAGKVRRGRREGEERAGS